MKDKEPDLCEVCRKPFQYFKGGSNPENHNGQKQISLLCGDYRKYHGDPKHNKLVCGSCYISETKKHIAREMAKYTGNVDPVNLR